MKAAVLNTCPGELAIEDIQLDEPGPREVLIRTVASGLCHSDLHFMEGTYPAEVPIVLGHESAGVVEAVGSQVSYVRPGDRVVTCLSVFCGHCEFCISGRMSLCQNPETRRGPHEASRLSRGGQPVNQFANLSSFAEEMLVHEHAVVKVDDAMPLDLACLLGCGATTGLGAVLNTAQVKWGETVAVIGCGGIGLSAIQGASIAGAARIIAIDVVASKLELAKHFGATDTIDASQGDPVGQAIDLTDGGVHHAFEAIGLKTTAEQAFGMLRRGGTATIIGLVPIGQNLELPANAFIAEKKIQGSNMGSNRFRVDIPRYIDLYLQGRLKLDELVSARIAIEEINEGYAAMKTGEVARSVIVFD